MSDEISLDNLDFKGIWQVLESMNLDKLTGLTFDEYVFISSLPANMSVDEITAHLIMYRQNKKIRNNDKEDKEK